jgi:hypothetical protein
MKCSICEDERSKEELTELFGFKICKDCLIECSNILMTTGMTTTKGGLSSKG